MKPSEIVLATGNPGKIGELRALLIERGFVVRPQSEFGCLEVAETGASFVENALLKARSAARCTGLPVIADDSGLMCDALAGAPGVYSARFAGVGATDAENIACLLDAMAGVTGAARTCRFICVMAYLSNAEDPRPVLAEGRWEGMVANAPVGARGFGYDPIFWVPEEACTAAALDLARKQALSHRGQALRELLTRLPPLRAGR